MNSTPKIFCLGLSRTGTTSLHAALVLMGFGSIHYPGKAAGRWMAGDFQTDMLEHFDACLDLPTPIYYPQLDKRYPGSKFILLEREPDAWLDSVRRQWQASAKSSQKTLLRDVVRIAVYGTRRFNASRLRYVYETHQRNARDYFRDRGDDFIALNVTTGDGWDKLSRFLNVKKPEGMEAFPRLRTPYIGRLAEIKSTEARDHRDDILALIEGTDNRVRRTIPEA